MKSLKILLALFFCVAIISSCSEENTENPIDEDDEQVQTTPTAANSLKSFTVDQNGAIYSFYFHYYDNKLDKLAYVSASDEITYYSFAYNTSGKIEETTKYVTKPNTTLVDFNDSNNFTNIDNFLTHKYHDDNNLKEIAGSGYAYNNGLTAQIMSLTMFPTVNIFYDANNKIERTDSYTHMHDPGVSNFLKFDNHKNPFYYLFDEFGFVIDKNLNGVSYNGSTSTSIGRIIKDLYCISPYNITEKKEYDETMWPTYTVDYTYNTDDYPLEGIFISENLDTQQQTIKYTINFTYY